MKRFAALAAVLSLALSGISFVLASGAGARERSAASSTGLPTLTLAVTKNSVTVGGAEVSGAVNVATTVSGEAGDNPALILLKPGVTASQFGAVVAKIGNKPLDAIDPYGTIVYDSQNALKGKTTIGQVVLPAGNYVAVNNGNGYATFTVTQSSSPASLPAPAATVTAIDFGFRGAATLHDGSVVRFQNDGYLIHMFLFGQVKSLAAAQKAEALLLQGKLKAAGKTYGTGVKGQFAGPLSSGSMQQEVVNEPPGVYVILCAMNAEDGRDHYQLGMFRTIRIVK
ncbi:MAG TPA: hypothetical protein VEF89_19575 [Solirubrobacteraceae bacterium]|nr:hypothetical protein [Solirubrobacteraceae bacterium]